VLVAGLLLACSASLGVEAWFVVPSKNNWRATDTRWSAATATATATTVRSGGTVRPQLTMKRAPKPKVSVVMEQDGELPSNLSRKVQASRPALGHVVPKSSKVNNAGGSKDPRLRPQGKARQEGMNNPSNLKILGGSARGRKLDSPNVYLRPMMGKVREAVYSTLTSFGLYDYATTQHLDIFAGSGSVGLESLSRGASSCTFVDLARDCCNAVERNLDLLEFTDRGRVVCGDALQVLREGVGDGSVFQIVTLCPPYEEVVYADLIDAVVNSPMVTEDTIVVLEYPVELGCLPHVVTRADGGAMIGVRNRSTIRTNCQ